MTDSAAVVFEAHRPLLLGLGYRLLGSMWDAEGVDVADQQHVRPPHQRAERRPG